MHIIFENENLVVIDKPAGILVHPTEKHEPNTLVDFITNQWPEIKKYTWPDPTRPGIVHRLDQDTSGTIIIAKSPDTLKFLQDQFKSHNLKKIYLALVIGHVTPEKGEIITQISRDRKSSSAKQKISSFSFSWQKSKSREAITYYKVLKYFTYKNQPLTLLELEIKTGRTHQIRAQLSGKNWPIIGDMLYNNKDSKNISQLLNLNRQFLHAKELEISISPHERKKFISPLPKELDNILRNISIN